LTDPEWSLLLYLTIRTIAEQTGATEDSTADALDELAGRGEVLLRGDVFDAYVNVHGRDLVHCARDWLSFMAMAAEDGDAPPAIGTPIEPTDPPHPSG
jgi:hypothetical protein